ncbi:MAG TPA: adventurous gliding motility protein GltG [Myxococcaceae bacterium]|nr:adventurous gliding motility protein GltG [Myxococcaceae bacterium]
MAVPLTLKVYKGDELVATKDYDRDIIKIGRLSSAHLCLDDEKVSRIHSVIEVGADGTLSIIDMGSVEGTYVNGKRVNKGALTLGDTIKVGNTTIHVESPGAQSAAQEPEREEATTQFTGSAAVANALAEAVAEVNAPQAPPPQVQPALEPSLAQTEHHPVAAGGNRSRPTRRRAAGPLGLELRFVWGDQMVGEFFLKPGKAKPFTVGSAAGVDFVIGDGKLGGPRFELVKADGHGHSLRFNGKMTGELHRGEEAFDLKRLIESNKASHDGDAYALSLDPDDFVRLELGSGVAVEVCYQPVPKAVVVPLLENIDFSVLNIFLVTFFLAALFVITAENRNLEGDEYADELSGNQARLAKLIIKPPEVQKNPLLEKLAAQKEKSSEMAAKSRGDEGQMGKKDAAKTGKRTAPKGDPNNKDTARMLTQKIFGSGAGGISTVFGKAGLGGELKAAMGNMFGNAAGDSKGLGGLGLRGSGAGGGGVGDTVGIGGIGTKGRGGGTGSYGSGAGILSGKKDVDIGITSSDPVVMGSLDKELIRQVIHRNRGQIRFCYESQLQRFPKLQGKVAVKFVISAAGSVASSSVAQSSAGNPELETCVAGRVRTWQFPKPKGGGVVIVTYPFIFKQSGE